MATVRPLLALRYAPERIDLGLVLAPPGAMDADERRALHEREPRNVVRVLEDGAIDEASPELVARRAALHLAEWRRAGVLVREEHPALYLVRQRLDDEEGERTSLGFFASLELDAATERDVRMLSSAEEPDEGLVETHRVHLSTSGIQTGAAVFTYDDESGRIERALRAEMEEREPDLRGRAFGALYELWVVDDETTTARVARHLEEQALTIVSGHERYEATRLLQRERTTKESSASETSSSAPLNALGFFVKAHASERDDEAPATLLPPRGLVLAPLLAVGDDDG